MKALRLWLVVLLALLLPIRGAVAAAMMCPPMGQGPQQIERAPTDHHAHHEAPTIASTHASGHDHALDHHGHEQGQGSDPQKAPTGPDACNVCASFCSVVPMTSSPPTVAQPQLVSALSFPELLAPAPSFTSGGQDRPPRSI